MQYDFFLSYRRTDQALARALALALEIRGARVWWDIRIEGGEDWREAIVTSLEASEALVILFSDACNSSKQLRKELAVADLLDKQIIPVLIEPVTPRGHYLYELAALNWLQIHPDPASRIDELSERLVSELDLPGAAAPPVAAEREEAAPEAVPEVSPTASEVMMSDTAPESPAGTPARAPVRAPKRPAPKASASARGARKRSAAPQKTSRARAIKAKKPLRNLLAFKWYEVLIALLLAILPVLGARIDPETGAERSDMVLTLDFLMVALVLLIVIAIIVFPFRYYFRRIRARAALFYHLSSVWLLSAVLGILSGIHPEFVEETMGVGENVAVYMLVWGGLTLLLSMLAFLIYGALHFQRSLRELKSNTEVIGAPSKA